MNEWPADECLEIRTLTDTVVVQTRARAMAATMGFSRQAQWEIATAASEAATNVVKHARRGRLHLRARFALVPCFEFEAVDEGEGGWDLAFAIQDGVSEGIDLSASGPIAAHRGLGLGLGAIRRLMDRLEVLSTAQGTIVRAQKDLVVPPRGR